MNTLYNITGINTPEEFAYFENMAELMEAEEEISEADLTSFLRDLDMSVFAELLAQYFDHIQEWIPDGETEVYTLVENIRGVISGMSYQLTMDMSDEETQDLLVHLADEITKFRNWFLVEEKVSYTNTESHMSGNTTVVDALACARAEALGEDAYRFDFSKALEYPLDRLTVLV